MTPEKNQDTQPMADNQNAWGAAAGGELAELVEQQRRIARREWLVNMSGKAALAVGALGVGGYFLSRAASDSNRSNPLACAEVVALLPDYIDQKLDRQTRQSISQHLAECNGCRHKQQQLIASV